MSAPSLITNKAYVKPDHEKKRLEEQWRKCLEKQKQRGFRNASTIPEALLYLELNGWKQTGNSAGEFDIAALMSFEWKPVVEKEGDLEFQKNPEKGSKKIQKSHPKKKLGKKRARALH